MTEIRLSPESLDLLADAIVERLQGDQGSEFVDAAEIARRFGVGRDWVYANADELGAVPLGDGERPRLRFDPTIVAARLSARPHPLTDPQPRRHKRRHSPPGGGAPLLPIKD